MFIFRIQETGKKEIKAQFTHRKEETFPSLDNHLNINTLNKPSFPSTRIDPFPVEKHIESRRGTNLFSVRNRPDIYIIRQTL